MRASRNGRSKSARAGALPLHVSGAEGIFPRTDLPRVVSGFVQRALDHPRGEPDEITVTIEKLSQKPLAICSLPVRTLRCRIPAQAERAIRILLRESGITEDALRAAMKVLKNRMTMRGAALVLAETGQRAEPDRQRGVRASRLGITRRANTRLSGLLEVRRINTDTVREALVLASKVAACKGVVAELCISDDPDYTTGYIASRALGYLRIPNIKKKGAGTGGRVFFIRDDERIPALVDYLEKQPVLVSRISACEGVFSLDEITGRDHR